MKRFAVPEVKAVPWGLLGSLLLHVLVLAVLVFGADFHAADSVQEQSIDVMVVTSLPETPETVPEPATAPSGATPSTSPPATKPDPQISADREGGAGTPVDHASPVMIRPKQMLSERVLNEPRSREAKKGLAKLAGSDLAVQLCSLEGMAQIAAWRKSYHPDMLIAYALADIKLAHDTLQADGAAFHSKQDWYNLRFKCDLTPNHMKVLAFEFLVGEAIPHKEWESHNLPEMNNDHD